LKNQIRRNTVRIRFFDESYRSQRRDKSPFLQYISAESASAHYNEIIKEFYTEQKMNVPDDWSEHSEQRIATVESLRGRDRLREVLNHLGFKLL
jgi:hypothetical protein